MLITAQGRSWPKEEHWVRIGVDVGGTNTDAVLLNNAEVLAVSKQPTSANVADGIRSAIAAVLTSANVAPSAVQTIMIGTTHFTNALVECRHLDRVGIIRLASPSGDALPPMTAWPDTLSEQIGHDMFLLPGGFEVDGREIAPLDEQRVRDAARQCRTQGITNIAISSAFAPVNAAMELRAAHIIGEEFPEARLSLSHRIGSLGLVERENGTILNAALISLATKVVIAFEQAIADAGLSAPLYISQNDGTLISAYAAKQLPVMTIGSGPTNSMRGAAFLTGESDAIVMDVGGTTCDIGVLTKGFPRESSIATDIGGIRTNFRMPDILALALGGGTRIHNPNSDDAAIGPDSVGYLITEEACIFGGSTVTATDIAVACGHTTLGDSSKLPMWQSGWAEAVWKQIQMKLADGIDRMKTTRGDATIIAVGGGHFLIGNALEGAARVIRPRHAEVANAIGAAIAQVGAQVEQIVDYDTEPRDVIMQRMRNTVSAQIVAAGGRQETAEIVEVEEVFLSYLPGRSAQVRMKAVGDLEQMAASQPKPLQRVEHSHAY
jgi:N-methylhydantoinase A/oxoprolinase/acetone carboxylase beta subunit